MVGVDNHRNKRRGGKSNASSTCDVAIALISVRVTSSVAPECFLIGGRCSPSSRISTRRRLNEFSVTNRGPTMTKKSAAAVAMVDYNKALSFPNSEKYNPMALPTIPKNGDHFESNENRREDTKVHFSFPHLSTHSSKTRTQ